ncbi:ankyrin, partial [Karstenula rhodostoma CBS 690.94]
DVSCQTALHTAAKNGHVDIVRLLIEKGAKMDAADDRGCTPLYKACGAKPDDSALYMINHAEQSINQRAKNGKTPLQKAAARGHRKIVEAIFERYDRDMAILTSTDNRNRTPLHTAARYGRKDVVDYLLQQGVSVTVQKKKGRRRFEHALTAGVNPGRWITKLSVCFFLTLPISLTLTLAFSM